MKYVCMKCASWSMLWWNMFVQQMKYVWMKSRGGGQMLPFTIPYVHASLDEVCMHECMYWCIMYEVKIKTSRLNEKVCLTQSCWPSLWQHFLSTWMSLFIKNPRLIATQQTSWIWGRRGFLGARVRHFDKHWLATEHKSLTPCFVAWRWSDNTRPRM